MVNKSLILDKVIGQLNESYNAALSQNDNLTAKTLQNKMQSIMQLKDQLESSGELNHNLPFMNRGGKHA